MCLGLPSSLLLFEIVADTLSYTNTSNSASLLSLATLYRKSLCLQPIKAVALTFCLPVKDVCYPFPAYLVSTLGFSSVGLLLASILGHIPATCPSKSRAGCSSTPKLTWSQKRHHNAFADIIMAFLGFPKLVRFAEASLDWNKQHSPKLLAGPGRLSAKKKCREFEFGSHSGLTLNLLLTSWVCVCACVH